MEKEKIINLLEEEQCLTEIPKYLGEILNMLNNPLEVDLNLLIDKVSKSKELNDLLLRNLNSGYFQLKREINTIKEAILYLGMHTVQNLLIFFITTQLFSKANKNGHVMFNMQKYWKHVMGTSVASSMLASQINKGDKYKLFSYGLLHDVGIVVLNICLPELLDEITKKTQKGIHQIVAERIVLGGLTHADIGAWLCKKWGIREDIINVVQYHHSPFLAQANAEEVQLIYTADVISTEYYQKLLGGNLNHSISKRVMQALSLSDEDIQKVIKAFPEELEKAVQFIKV